MKTCFIILTIVILLGLVGVGIYFYLTKGPIEDQIPYPPCLSDDEIAIYEMDKEGVVRGMVKISIRDQKNGTEKFSFQINNVSKAVHAIEVYKCNIYIIRVFNFLI